MFNIVPIMGEILKSITVPGIKLLSVVYLFIMTIYIYAAFGLQAFEGDFDYAKDDDQDDNNGCHSTMSCFWLIAYQGIPSGGYIEAGMIPQVRWIGSVSARQRAASVRPASVQRPLAPVGVR